MDPNTEKNGSNKTGGKDNGGNAAPSAPTPPALHEPAPSEIVKVVGDIVGKIETWTPSAQSRVLQSVAAALGVGKSANPPPKQQQGNPNQQRGSERR